MNRGFQGSYNFSLKISFIKLFFTFEAVRFQRINLNITQFYVAVEDNLFQNFVFCNNLQKSIDILLFVRFNSSKNTKQFQIELFGRLISGLIRFTNFFNLFFNHQ